MIFSWLVYAFVSTELFDRRMIRQAENAKAALLQNRIEDARHIINDPTYNVDYDFDPTTGRYLDVEMILQGKCNSNLVKTNHKIQLNLIIEFHNWIVNEKNLLHPEATCREVYEIAKEGISWTSDDVVMVLNKLHWSQSMNVHRRLASYLSSNLISFESLMMQMLSTSPPSIFSELFLKNLVIFNGFGYNFVLDLLNEIQSNKRHYSKQMIKMGISQEDSHLVIKEWILQVAKAIGTKAWEFATTPTELKEMISKSTPNELRAFPWVYFKEMLRDEDLMYDLVQQFLSSNVPLPDLNDSMLNSLRQLTSTDKSLNEDQRCNLKSAQVDENPPRKGIRNWFKCFNK